MDPAALLNPKAARRRGINPPTPPGQSPAFSFSSPYSTSNKTMSEEEMYWPPPLPYATQRPVATASDSIASAPGTPQLPVYPDNVTQQSNNLRSTPQIPSFDPRALLNPKSLAKRPAANHEPERGREEFLTSGQASLVERFHHVQERTASPAKRIRTEEEHKSAVKPQLGSGGALDLDSSRQQQASPAQSSTIDLTMSMALTHGSLGHQLIFCQVMMRMKK